MVKVIFAEEASGEVRWCFTEWMVPNLKTRSLQAKTAKHHSSAHDIDTFVLKGVYTSKSNGIKPQGCLIFKQPDRPSQGCSVLDKQIDLKLRPV